MRHNNAIKIQYSTATAVPAPPFEHNELQSATHFAAQYPCMGEGSFGSVHRVTIQSADSSSSVYVVKLAKNQSPAFQQLIFERKLLTQLHHPHIVRVLSTTEQNKIQAVAILNKNLAMMMPFYQHGDLYSALFGANRITYNNAALNPLKIAYGIASALNYIHQKGIIHRDIKAENVLLDNNNRAVLSDFGLALVVKNKKMAPPLDSTGTQFAYAPEILKLILNHFHDKKPVASAAQDVYAFGIILLFLARRSLPHDYLPQCFDIANRIKYIQHLRIKSTLSFLSLYSNVGKGLPLDNDFILNQVLRATCNPDPTKRPTAEQLEKFFENSNLTKDLFAQKHPIQEIWKDFEGCQTEETILTLRDQLDENSSLKLEPLKELIGTRADSTTHALAIRNYVLSKLALHKRKNNDESLTACQELVKNMPQMPLKIELEVMIFNSKLTSQISSTATKPPPSTPIPIPSGKR